MKNDYAKKLLKQRNILRGQEKRELISGAVDALHKIYAVELNELHGFGKERIDQLQKSVDADFLEWEALQESADWDFADGKLDERYEKIMGNAKSKRL